MRSRWTVLESKFVRFTLVLLFTASLAAACSCDDEEEEEVNRPPVADAGPDLEGLVGEPIEVQGSGTDPDGDPVTFLWTLHERPDGSQAALDGERQETVALTPDIEGTFVLGLVVSDGELESDEDTMQIVAEAPELITGNLTVRVVDHESNEPIAGAVVEIEGGRGGETDSSGEVEVVEPGLQGPLTVDVYHPDTIEGPMGETIPRWRGATLVDAMRSELVVPLRTSYEPPPAQTGRVTGHVHAEFFNELPPVGPVIPFISLPCDVDDFDENWEDCDPYYLDQVGSGQIRAVVVAPLTEKQPMSMEVSDLLGPPATEQSPLPGNLTSNDDFLSSLSSLMGIPAAPDGEIGLTWFDIELPAGEQSLLVLGILITVDTGILMDLVSRAQAGDPIDPGAILGTMSLETLLVGVVEVDVPAGDEFRFETEPHPGAPPGLTIDDLDEVYFIPADIEMQHALLPDPIDPNVDSQRRWAEVRFDMEGVVSAPTLLEDPRLESHVPDSVQVRVGDEWVTFDVPEDTGEPDTHVPYSLIAAVAETDRGLLPIGLAFTRAGDFSRDEALFGLPSREGPFDSAPIHAVGFTARGVGPGADGGAYELLPGGAAAREHLASGAPAALDEPLPLPALLNPLDAGLHVGLLLDRPDRDSTEVMGAAAHLIDLYDPDPEEHIISDSLELDVVADAHLTHIVIHRRDEIDEGHPIDTPLWDIYVEPSSELLIVLPESALDVVAGGEVRVDVRAARWSSPLDMERWSGERIMAGPRSYTNDTWLFFSP